MTQRQINYTDSQSGEQSVVTVPARQQRQQAARAHRDFFVNDVGLAAYLHMMRFRIARATRSGNFYFTVNDQKELRDILKAQSEYFESDFARFDQEKLTLLKMINRSSGSGPSLRRPNGKRGE